MSPQVLENSKGRDLTTVINGYLDIDIAFYVTPSATSIHLVTRVYIYFFCNNYFVF